MFDPISLAVGGVLLLIGFVGGKLSKRRPVVRAAPRPYMCTCPHSLSEHDPKSGRCLGQVKREHYLPGGSRNGWEYVQCPCASYVGDRPLPELDPTQILREIDKPK